MFEVFRARRVSGCLGESKTLARVVKQTALPNSSNPPRRKPPPCRVAPQKTRANVPTQMNLGPVLLIVDDSENDLLLMRRAFKKAEFDVRYETVTGGEQAIAYLCGEGEFDDREKHPIPTVLLLDLNMPGMSGFEVLRWVRGHHSYHRMCVIILSASMRKEDVETSFDLGANAFLVKPADLLELIDLMKKLRDWIHVDQFAAAVETLAIHQMQTIE
jgi:CheY-like chemotaxis protein